MRIVRIANFVMRESGGLRTALAALGSGYADAGHEPVLVVPGDRDSDVQTAQGRVITTRGWVVPGTGGYRVLIGRRRLASLLEELAPDRLEVSDRTTLRWTGRWARDRGVPAVMVSHESLSGLLAVVGLRGRPGRRIADSLNARTARGYDRVVCTTGWAAEEFHRIGAANLVRVPLGVDLRLFHPDRRDAELRSALAEPGQVLIIHCGRLSTEKRPGRSIDALADLRRTGLDAVLVVVGDGPMRKSLERRAAGLPVRFTNFVSDRVALAALLATADIAIAPGPIETFGLSALESMASGTPVVVDAASALPEVVAGAGIAVTAGQVAAFADGVRSLLRRPEELRRTSARRRAEEFGWAASVRGFLAAHGLEPTGRGDDGPAEAAAAVVAAAAAREDLLRRMNSCVSLS